MAKAKEEVRPLGNVYDVQGGSNLQLGQAVEKRFSDITVTMGDSEFVFLHDGEHQGVAPDALRNLVYAAIMAVNSPGNKTGDGAILYLHENRDHPQVAKLLQAGSELAYTISSDRTGVAGYRVPGPAILAIVEALAPVIENSIKEFGWPRVQSRGKKEAKEEVAIDFTW